MDWVQAKLDERIRRDLLLTGREGGRGREGGGRREKGMEGGREGGRERGRIAFECPSIALFRFFGVLSLCLKVLQTHFLPPSLPPSLPPFVPSASLPRLHPR